MYSKENPKKFNNITKITFKHILAKSNNQPSAVNENLKSIIIVRDRWAQLQISKFVELILIVIKELSLCYKFSFCKTYIFATL